jgi:uncharacterized Zn-finger protein
MAEHVGISTSFNPAACGLPNAERRYEIKHQDLPAHCPTDEMCLWNSHPRVYFALKNPGDEATCPYCSAVYILIED